MILNYGNSRNDLAMRRCQKQSRQGRCQCFGQGRNYVAELNGNSSNAMIRAYTYTPSADENPGEVLFIRQSNNQIDSPIYDGTRNVSYLVNGTTGNLDAIYEYSAYGNLLSSTGTRASENPLRFSGKYTDSETDLYYYGYRYYSTSLGRWISRDPIEEQGGLNLYGFVNNNPVNRWDKLGLIADADTIFRYKDKDGRNQCCTINNDSPGVKMGFRKFDEGLLYRVWHAYLQIGDSWKDWTIGWAGETYSETNTEKIPAEEAEKALRYTNDLKRKNKGNLPSGIPCKCATGLQIQECVKNRENYPVGSYNGLMRNCGDWAGMLATKCCLVPNYWIPGNRVWYGPTCGWDKE